MATEGGERPTVLVLEDDDEMRAMLELLVTKLGCRSLAVPKVAEAMRICERGKAHLLLLDLQMPGASGIDVLRTLKRRNLVVPTIVVSAFISAEAAKECAGLGVRAMVAKPFDRARLESEIRKQLSQVGYQLPS